MRDQRNVASSSDINIDIVETSENIKRVERWLFFFLKVSLFLLERQIYREKERQRERSSICWFMSQVATTVRVELI